MSMPAEASDSVTTLPLISASGAGDAILTVCFAAPKEYAPPLALGGRLLEHPAARNAVQTAALLTTVLILTLASFRLWSVKDHRWIVTQGWGPIRNSWLAFAVPPQRLPSQRGE